MKEYKSIFCGEKVILCPLERTNLRDYLSTYKVASPFSKVYGMMPDFWDMTSKNIQDYIVGEKHDRERYLIAGFRSLQSYGYIELDFSDPALPGVDIAVLREHRRKGYAYEAARILLENVLERESVMCVVWNAFSSNKASCRIAEKLGGTVVEGKNLMAETMREAGLKVESLDVVETLRTISYEIRKVIPCADARG